MKLLVAGITCLWLVGLAYAVAAPVIESRAWTERYPVDATLPQLKISKIRGNVRVRPGSSGEITVTIDEQRSTPNQELFERSLQTPKLNVDADGNGVSITVGDENRDFGPRNSCRRCRIDYRFEVLVPAGILHFIAQRRCPNSKDSLKVTP